MTDPLQARHLAAETVGRVLRDGAFSNVLVEAQTAALAPREAARVKALTYGVLRRVERLDAAIGTGAGRALDDVDVALLDRLRVSTFELLYSNLAQPIVVSAGVDLVREIQPKAAGFANAVLRRVAERGPETEEALDLPPWLMQSLEEAWGMTEARQFAITSASEPERVVRGEPGAAGIGAEVPGIPGAFTIAPGPIPEGTIVQDAASIAVGNAVAATPGMRVIDLAAAPGGKTSHLFDQVGDNGLVIGADSHRRRVSDARRRVPGARWVVADANVLPFRGLIFDRVLLDAPCSGLGTLRRRPEIRFRVTEAEVRRLATVQRGMLEKAMELVAPGGQLVYSVCTITPQETIEVVAGRGFEPPSIPGSVWGDGRLLAPHLTGTDGMFVALHRA
ncbi:MAG TPA: RsmB/NOP family class I SAM-dependent RNA methyltransferase [Acidimicrobiia bacterium]|nr:RsmB/NOP family class I SAM-dependent RNA methyltransferase [Acidimicrobiia bacterium]